MNYSINDILIFYNSLFKVFEKKEKIFENEGKNKQIIYTASGLSLTNSIHEMFIKSFLENHKKIHGFTSKDQDDLTEKYKSPGKIIKFISDLNLDVDEAFRLYRKEIQRDFSIIRNFREIIVNMRTQRKIRNDFNHGDFSITNEITREVYNTEIVKFQKLHSFLLKIIYYSYSKDPFICNNLKNFL